jgi:hypothetical protein
MTNEELIEQVYAAYNRQDADALLAFVSEDVDWPDGQARLHGKQGLRAYWTRQWAKTRTRDEVLAIATPMPNRSIVRIGQVVRALTGAVISTGTFEHDYLIENRLIMRLDIRRL